MPTRRSFLQAALAATTAGTVLPLVPTPANAFCAEATSDGPWSICGDDPTSMRPAGDPPFEPFWVATHLSTKLWHTAMEVEHEIGTIEPGRLFRVDAPQQGYRLLVWDPRENRHIYIGSEAVGATGAPFWSAFADDGRWVDVYLSLPQHLKARQFGFRPNVRQLRLFPREGSAH